MVHPFGLASCEGSNTTSICLLQSLGKLMLLASGLWMVYDLLHSGKTFKIPEGEYLASIISSVCYPVGWRAGSLWVPGSCCLCASCLLCSYCLPFFTAPQSRDPGGEAAARSIPLHPLLLAVFTACFVVEHRARGCSVSPFFRSSVLRVDSRLCSLPGRKDRLCL